MNVLAHASDVLPASHLLRRPILPVQPIVMSCLWLHLGSKNSSLPFFLNYLRRHQSFGKNKTQDFSFPFFFGGSDMSFLLRIGFCLAVFVLFVVPSNLNGQVTYTITGFTSPFGGQPPEVGSNESYVAEFVIDESVLDSNPDPNEGLYVGAILSSSITFAGGYVSQVDFAGGNVDVRADFGGSGFFLNAPSGNAPAGSNTFVVGVDDNTLESDALLTDLGSELVGSEFSLAALQEPTGLITSISQDPDVGFDGGPIVLTVTVGVTDSTLIGDVNLDGVFDFFDIQPFIDLLMAVEFQAEGDIDGNGFVDFFDIQPFIAALGLSRGQ